VLVALELGRLGDLDHRNVEELHERAVLGARDREDVRDGRRDTEALAEPSMSEGAGDRVRVGVPAQEDDVGVVLGLGEDPFELVHSFGVGRGLDRCEMGGVQGNRGLS
jgi:hypothetical protein